MKINRTNINLKTACILLFVLTAVLNPGFAQKEPDIRADVLATQLQEWYNPETGLWETTSWWNGANALTALIKYGQLTDNQIITKTIENTFSKTRRFEVPASDTKDAWICTNYINDYYDDEGWWALAWLDAWEWTGNDEYLEMARYIFRDITTGWDETCGGGIYWKKGLGYKSTISNELTLLLATRLHHSNTDTINGRSCLDWSLDIWNWMFSGALINDKGLVADGVRNANGDCKISPRVWTYNQGVILSGLTYLGEITGDKSYFDHAHGIARAAIGNMVNESGVLFETGCEQDNCNADAEQFKGIFMRHLAVLNHYSPKKEYYDFINFNAQSIWKNAMRNGTVPPGVSWSTFSEKSNAATASSALDAFNAALTGEK